jgi:hypothetical protein
VVLIVKFRKRLNNVIEFNLLHMAFCCYYFLEGNWVHSKFKGDLNNDLLRFQILITFNLNLEYRANIPVQECKCFTPSMKDR